MSPDPLAGHDVQLLDVDGDGRQRTHDARRTRVVAEVGGAADELGRQVDLESSVVQMNGSPVRSVARNALQADLVAGGALAGVVVQDRQAVDLRVGEDGLVRAARLSEVIGAGRQSVGYLAYCGLGLGGWQRGEEPGTEQQSRANCNALHRTHFLLRGSRVSVTFPCGLLNDVTRFGNKHTVPYFATSVNEGYP